MFKDTLTHFCCLLFVCLKINCFIFTSDIFVYMLLELVSEQRDRLRDRKTSEVKYFYRHCLYFIQFMSNTEVKIYLWISEYSFCFTLAVTQSIIVDKNVSIIYLSDYINVVYFVLLSCTFLLMKKCFDQICTKTQKRLITFLVSPFTMWPKYYIYKNVVILPIHFWVSTFGSEEPLQQLAPNPPQTNWHQYNYKTIALISSTNTKPMVKLFSHFCSSPLTWKIIMLNQF